MKVILRLFQKLSLSLLLSSLAVTLSARADFYGNNGSGNFNDGGFQQSFGGNAFGGYPGSYGGGGRADNGTISLELNPQIILNSAFRMAARESRFADMEKFSRQGADINGFPGKGVTALIYAARACNVKVVQKLIEMKADVNLRDKDGRTALMHAAKGSCLDATKILLKTPGVDLDVKEFHTGNTALSFAEDSAVPEVDGPAIEVVRLLRKARSHRPIAHALPKKEAPVFN